MKKFAYKVLDINSDNKLSEMDLFYIMKLCSRDINFFNKFTNNKR
jgi:hypothetical protein